MGRYTQAAITILSTSLAYQCYRLQLQPIPRNPFPTDIFESHENQERPPAVVIGGGVVGVCTAYELAKRGYSVKLIDSGDEISSECSAATAGGMQCSNVAFDRSHWKSIFLGLLPWSELFGNYKIRWTTAVYDPHWIPWMLTFSAHGLFAKSEEDLQRETNMLSFTAWSIRQMLQLMHQDRGNLANAADLSVDGTVAVLSNGKAYARQEALTEEDGEISRHASRCTSFDDIPQRWEGHRRLRRPNSLEAAVLIDAEEAIALEPMLVNSNRAVFGAVYEPLAGRGNCPSFTKALAGICADRYGVQFVKQTKVRDFTTSHGTITGLRTDRGAIALPPDTPVVLAAGSWTPYLCWRLGLFVPIYPMKGYTLMVDLPPASAAANTPSPQDVPQRAVTFHDMFIARLGTQIRMSAFGEFDGWSTQSRPEVDKKVRKSAKHISPALGAHIDAAPTVCGLRPMSADGCIIAGRTEQYSNLYLNVGPGHNGWKTAVGAGALTARWVAERAGAAPDTEAWGFDARLLAPQGRVKPAPWVSRLCLQRYPY